MSLTQAITNLASLPVNGISHTYTLTNLPHRLESAQLPALLILPIEQPREGLFRDVGAGLHLAHFSGGAGRVAYTLTHLLLVAPADSAGGWRQHLAPLVGFVDTYMTAIASNPRLDASLAEPATVRAEMGIFTYGQGRTIPDTRYIGCAFRHEWVLVV